MSVWTDSRQVLARQRKCLLKNHMSVISRQVRAIEPVAAANSPYVGLGWVQEVVLVAGATGGTGRSTIRALMRNNEKSDRSRWIIRALARKPDALKGDLDSDLGLQVAVDHSRLSA